MTEINYFNFEGIPNDKYIICIDSIGLRSRLAAKIFNREGFLALYVEGGYDMLLPLIADKEI